MVGPHPSRSAATATRFASGLSPSPSRTVFPPGFIGPLPVGASRGPTGITASTDSGSLVTAPAASTVLPASFATSGSIPAPTLASSTSIDASAGVAASIAFAATSTAGGSVGSLTGSGAGSSSTGGAGAGSSAGTGLTVTSTTTTGGHWAVFTPTGGGWTYEWYQWSETVVTGSDGRGGTYTTDDLQTGHYEDWNTPPYGHTLQVTSETYTLSDSGGSATEDEAYHANDTSTTAVPPGQYLATDEATTSDTFDFEGKGDAPVATGGVAGDDAYDNTVHASQTTDHTSMQYLDSQGGGSTRTTANDEGSESYTTSDNGADTLIGSPTGTDTFTAGTTDSDSWTHVATANTSTDDSGTTTGSSTTTDTDTGQDAASDGVQGNDSFTSGSSGGTDNFTDGGSLADQYNLSVTTTTALAGGVTSGSTSATLIASGVGKASDEDQGGDTNGDGTSDTFDGTFTDKEVWTTDETASSSYDGLGGTTAGGSANDTDSDATSLTESGSDSGPIADNSTAKDTETTDDTTTGSWSVAISPSGATTGTGSVSYDDTMSDVAGDSDSGSDLGDGFKQGDSYDVQEHDTETDNADGSDQYKVTANGDDSSSFDLSGPDAGGSTTLDESGSDQWTSLFSGADAANGSGSASFSANDGGGDSLTDSGSGTATTPIPYGNETDSVVLNENSSDDYSDSIMGHAAVDASGNVSGNESYSSSDSGQGQLTLTDTGGDGVSYGGANQAVVINGGGTASDTYSLHGTDGDTYSITDAGSITVGPEGTTGNDTLSSHVTGTDSLGGSDTTVCTPLYRPDDVVNLAFTGSDTETLAETVTTTESGGATSTSTSGTDSGSDTFDLNDSDARNAYTQDDSDNYDDPLGAAAGASAAPPAAGSGASGIRPAGASASDTSSATHSGTVPEDPNSAYWSAFFGNLWDRATYVPKTVWATTGDTGYGLAGRVYVTAGTTVGSLVGVTQVSDAFARHDAVDAHEQTTGERVFKGVSGSVQLATLGAGAAGKVTAAVPIKVGIPTSQPNFAIISSGIAPRNVRFLPSNPANPGWGLTPSHLEKHFFGNTSSALKQIDPGATADKWAQHLAELIHSPVTNTTSNGMLDIIKTFARANGSGRFKMGVRLAPKPDGTFDLITVLTKQ